MKKSIITLGAFALLAGAAQAQTVLVDLGNDSSYRGVSMAAGADSNGNYWNTVYGGAYYADMVDTTGAATTIDFGFSYTSGEDSYNGPAGDTSGGLDPSLSDYDAGALGNLGQDAAVFDFYVNSGFEIQGLDATKTYDLTFYSSHKWSDNAVTTFTIWTDATYATSVATGDLQVMDPAQNWLHNRDTTLTLSGLSPQTSDILYVTFAGAAGGSGYLNAMSITEVPAPASVALLGLGGMLAGRRRRA